ncbi:hypothetical protein [Oleiharenicola lentus]|uniref:hypothetical protein n=1 Tax=Oleiharenicola lentus TaxID=2508720 RepID=UPI003F670E9E
MPDESDPPRKYYGLKPREFTRINEVVSAEPTSAPPGDNDVHVILRQNQVIARDAGLNEIVIKKVVSRRKRDYWTVLIAGNLCIAGLTAFVGLNPLTAMFGLAGCVLLSVGLTWIMWVVMDNY